ncbi:MAG: alkaline phosphatase family protein [Candidatus Aureabacteria bacterium]|nr:alkaline phosphatase family protein [Candidatus Auribacterota bacterium]
METKKKKRNILIGLDGVPHLLIERYTRKGIMPNLRRFINSNTFLKMNSSVPEVSSVAWSSIITGTNPGEHGIFGFMDVNHRNYSLMFPDARDLQVAPFWQRYKQAAVINVPSTYPAQPMNGFLISGFVSIDLEGAVYPRSMLDEIKTSRYRIDVNNSLAKESPSGFIDDLHKTLEVRLKFLEKIWDREERDLIVFVVSGTDRLNHYFWNAFDDISNSYKSTFEEYYNLVDRAIGRILDRCTDDDNVIIFSEHGFETLDVEFYVNRFLQEKGYVQYKNDDPKTPVDLDITTKAFALDPGRIYINSSDKFLFGRVKPTEKETLMTELEILFKNLVIDGKKMIKKVYRGNLLYKGPFVKNAPDLILLGEDGVDLKGKFSVKKMTDKRMFNGKHKHNNAFITFSRKKEIQDTSKPYDVEKIIKLLE